MTGPRSVLSPSSTPVGAGLVTLGKGQDQAGVRSPRVLEGKVLMGQASSTGNSVPNALTLVHPLLHPFTSLSGPSFKLSPSSHILSNIHHVTPNPVASEPNLLLSKLSALMT